MLRGVSDRLFNCVMVQRHLFRSQTISRLFHYLTFWLVSSTECNAAVLTVVSLTVGTFNPGMVYSLMRLVCFEISTKFGRSLLTVNDYAPPLPRPR